MSNTPEPPIPNTLMSRLEKQYAAQKSLNPDGADNLVRDFFAAVEHIRVNPTPDSVLVEKLRMVREVVQSQHDDFSKHGQHAARIALRGIGEGLDEIIGDASTRKDEAVHNGGSPTIGGSPSEISNTGLIEKMCAAAWGTESETDMTVQVSIMEDALDAIRPYLATRQPWTPEVPLYTPIPDAPEPMSSGEIPDTIEKWQQVLDDAIAYRTA